MPLAHRTVGTAGRSRLFRRWISCLVSDFGLSRSEGGCRRSDDVCETRHDACLCSSCRERAAKSLRGRAKLVPVYASSQPCFVDALSYRRDSQAAKYIATCNKRCCSPGAHSFHCCGPIQGLTASPQVPAARRQRAVVPVPLQHIQHAYRRAASPPFHEQFRDREPEPSPPQATTARRRRSRRAGRNCNNSSGSTASPSARCMWERTSSPSSPSSVL